MKKKINFIKAFVILTVASLFTIACSKPEDGAPGPAGPAGMANVIYSNWTAQTFTYNAGIYTGILNPNAPLNQEIINKGFVYVYWKNTAGVEVTIEQLNFYNLNSNLYVEHFLKENGSIELEANFNISSNDRFRYILIPGGTPATTGKQAQPDFKKMSYNEVCKYLHIPE